MSVSILADAIACVFTTLESITLRTFLQTGICICYTKYRDPFYAARVSATQRIALYASSSRSVEQLC